MAKDFKSKIRVSNANENSERGAVLLITMAIVAVFFVVMLYGIELSSILSSAGQQQYNARFVTLAALEEYYDTDCESPEDTSVCHSDRMKAALDRARDIAGYNVTLKSSRGDAASIAEVGQVTLESGRWYSTDDNSGACESINKDYPCFVPGDEDINSFNLKGQIYQPAFFMAKTATLVDALPEGSFDVNVVASVIPRHGCFLVDISGSTQRGAHLLQSNRDFAPKILRTQFAYYLKEDGNAVPDGSSHEKLWPELLAQGPRPVGVATDYRRHYFDDYELKQTLGDGDYSSSDSYAKHHPSPSKYGANRKSGRYRIDFFRDETHLGPEPLTTILSGLHEAVSLFENRAVAGDKACIIFYDNELVWTRVLNLTSEFDYLKSIVDPGQLKTPKDPIFGYKLNSERDLPLALQHNLFPALDGFTFTQMAISEALAQFKKGKDEIGSVSNFLVHIGDGLTNCSAACRQYDQDNDGKFDEERVLECYSLYWNELSEFGDIELSIGAGVSQELIDACSIADVNGDGIFQGDEWWGIFENFGCEVCTNVYYQYDKAIRELRNTADSVLHKGKIPLHAILVGEHVEPHTLDVFDADLGRCLTDEEAREREKDFTDYIYAPDKRSERGSWSDANSSFENMFKTGADPFYQANYDWYTLARMTGGFWGPIRPKHPGCVDLSSEAEISAALGGVCNDGERRKYDHKCRTPEKQIRDYMTTIMNQNPYAIVSSD